MRKIFFDFSVFLILVAVFCIGADAQRTIDGVRVGIVNGKATFLPKPDYPPEARESCAGGKVEIKVTIGENGDVLEAEALSGDELLRAASVEAARKAKFGPLGHGVPVKLQGILVYNFDPFAPKCISVGVVNKKALKMPKPSVNVRPPGKEVIVAVQVVIDMNGKVTKAKAVFGHPLIRYAFEKAARQARFSPAFINGPPIKVRALLVYKFKPDGSIETDIEKDDTDVIGTPVNLVEPAPPFCNCQGLGGGVLVQAKIDEQGNVTQATAFSGHPLLRKSSEKAALESKFLPTRIKSKILIAYNFEAPDKEGRTAKYKDFEIKKVEIEK